MSFLSLAVVWAGYQLIWYGYCQLQGPGIGFADLIRPSQIGKVNSFLSTAHPSSPSDAQPGEPAGYSPSSTSPGGSATTPPSGWLPVPGNSSQYYNPQYPGDVWVSGTGVLQA